MPPRVKKGPKPRNNSDSALDNEKIQGQVQRILDSPEFNATTSQRAFFQFVVSETLAGRSHEIKGYTVATRVFGRKADFDPNLDPIVSIQANKLRRALERYYLVAGQNDPVRIDIPKGAYVPTFREQTGIEPGETAISSRTSDVNFEQSWPSVMVRPFQNLTGDPEQNYLGIGVATELTVELSRYQEIVVFMGALEDDVRRDARRGPRFVIDGSVRRHRRGTKVTVHFVDTNTNTQLWGDTHHCDEAAQLVAFEEEIARVVAAKIAGEYGIISRTLSMESKNKPPSELKAYEAILRYYEYNRTLTPASFSRALEALEHAAKIEPGCGQVWSMLGRLYGNMYSLEFPGFATALENAVKCAEKGLQLNPGSQRARGTLALIRMFSNEIRAARAEAEKALALNPRSLFILDGIGYLMTLLGEWERGPALIRRVIQLNPYYGLYVHYALWVDWIHQANFEQAHLETLNFRRPSVFWEPLMKAATFGRLGRIEEGKRAVEDLLKLKPDFATRGRVLIKHYIKFEDILERMLEGLHNAGLRIES